MIKELFIINQDRTQESKDRLQNLGDKIQVLEFPKSKKHFEITGHDHAYVLNEAIKMVNGDIICIYDSDCHPFSSQWIIECNLRLESYDAILSLESPKKDLTHPCFMVLKQKHVEIPISFDEGLFTHEIDTGRLIGRQLINAGQNVYFAEPKRAFNNMWGNIYLDTIYHHQKGSFSGGDKRLTSQITWRQNFFRYIVAKKNKYSLTKTDYLIYKLIKHYQKHFRKI